MVLILYSNVEFMYAECNIQKYNIINEFNQ